jgi:hypothetical protein
MNTALCCVPSSRCGATGAPGRALGFQTAQAIVSATGHGLVSCELTIQNEKLKWHLLWPSILQF